MSIQYAARLNPQAKLQAEEEHGDAQTQGRPQAIYNLPQHAVGHALLGAIRTRRLHLENEVHGSQHDPQSQRHHPDKRELALPHR